jgi:hypothetical protein
MPLGSVGVCVFSEHSTDKGRQVAHKMIKALRTAV